MAVKFFCPTWFLLLALCLPWSGAVAVQAAPAPGSAPTMQSELLSPEQLMNMVNQARTSHGLATLIVDPILMSTAQSTANIMAANRMSDHIGDLNGRVASAGYGKGDIPFAVENFVVLPADMDSGIILLAWSDSENSKPMTDPRFRHIGAGVARTPGGDVYYVIHAGYTSNRTYLPGPTIGARTPTSDPLSRYIFAVQTVTPRPDGALMHIVRAGQSLWSIAIAYQTHIEEIQRLNGMSQEQFTIYPGQKLRIPTRTSDNTPVPAGSRKSPTETPLPVQTATRITPGVSASATVLPTVVEATSRRESQATLEQTVTTVLVIMAVIGMGLVMIGVLVNRR